MLLLESTSDAKLFISIINKSGPITPPLKIGKDSENVLPITTLCVLS